jgi:hypothetical protein
MLRKIYNIKCQISNVYNNIKCQNGPVLPPAPVFYFNGQGLNKNYKVKLLCYRHKRIHYFLIKKLIMTDYIVNFVGYVIFLLFTYTKIQHLYKYHINIVSRLRAFSSRLPRTPVTLGP